MRLLLVRIILALLSITGIFASTFTPNKVEATAVPAQPGINTSIITAKAFQNIYQAGDILIIFEYNIDYPDNAIPPYNCDDLFYYQLMDGNTVLTPSHMPLNYYGYNMASLYFPAVSSIPNTTVSELGISWGTYTYKIEIAETNLFAVPATFVFELSSSSQWITEPDMTLAQNDVRTYILASIIGGSTGIQINTGVTYIANTSNSAALNPAGRILVLSAIPGLDTPIPQLFQLSIQEISVLQPTATGSLQTNLTLENQLGTQISTAFTNLGNLLHVSGQQVALGWILVCILILVGIIFLATGNLIGATICALPMALIGVWIGAVPVAFIFVGTMVIVVLLGYYLFIRAM